MFKIIDEPIRLEGLVASVSGRGIGGIATFVGTVRDRNAGKQVVAVEYQAYPPMAERVMLGIGEEARKRFGALGIAMVHRVGRLEIGESSVAIVVGAEHRREALEAVAYSIERLKQIVPVWKKEFYADGSAWLEPAAGVSAEPTPEH